MALNTARATTPSEINVSVTPGAASLAVSWPAVRGADWYRVEYKKVSATEWTEAANISGRSYTIGSLDSRGNITMYACRLEPAEAFSLRRGQARGTPIRPLRHHRSVLPLHRDQGKLSP